MHFILGCSQLRWEGRKANTELIPQMAPSQRCHLWSLGQTPHPSWIRDGVGLGLGCPRGLHQEPPIPGLPWAGPALLCPEATRQ